LRPPCRCGPLSWPSGPARSATVRLRHPKEALAGHRIFAAALRSDAKGIVVAPAR
jgi:hypothetical protein